jgi:hypothetical protein
VVAPSGYTLVLPPGWRRIPLRSGTDEAIAEIVEHSFAGTAPRPLEAERELLRSHLHGVASAAAANSGLDLYLPTELFHGFTVAASFVVAELSFGSVERPDPGLVLARVVSHRDGTLTVTVGGTTGARTESVAAPDPSRDAPFASRRVDYVLPVPKDDDRWLVVTFSTIGQGDPQDEFAGLLVDLFDAIMTTFRWTT